MVLPQKMRHSRSNLNLHIFLRGLYIKKIGEEPALRTYDNDRKSLVKRDYLSLYITFIPM